jgi:hypothetical protein
VVAAEEAEVKAAEEVEVKVEEAEVKAGVVEEHKAEELVVEEHKQAEDLVTTATTRRRQREITKSDVAGKLPRRRGLTVMGVTKESNLFELELERRAEVPSAIEGGEVLRDVIGRVKRKPDTKHVLSAELLTSQST